MNSEQLLRLVDELVDIGTKMIVFLGGEFSIVKDIEKVIDRIIARGMVCDVVTNAILLPKKIDMFKKLDSICISMDGLGDSNDITRGKRIDVKNKGSRLPFATFLVTNVILLLNGITFPFYRQTSSYAKVKDKEKGER